MCDFLSDDGDLVRGDGIMVVGRGKKVTRTASMYEGVCFREKEDTR